MAKKYDVKSFEGLYKINKEGKIYSTDMEYIMPRHNIKLLRKSRLLKTCVSGKMKTGYKFVTLCKNKKKHRLYVHRIMAHTFLGLDLKSKLHVNHKDCNKLNNCLSNLEILTSKENSIHARDNNRLKHLKLTKQKAFDIRKLLIDGLTQQKIADIYKVSQATISEISLNKIWNDL